MAGAPSRFNKRTMDKIEFMIKRGFTIKEIAFMLDCTQNTYYNWKAKNPEFFKKVEDWKYEADKKVERSLRERATGYNHPEERTHYDATQKEWVKTTVTKYYPPDPTSMIFWLKNRQPDKWKDKRDVDINDVTVSIERKRFDGESNRIHDSAARKSITAV